MTTATRTGTFHPLPVIGHPQAFYDRHIEEAEKAGNAHAKASYKVGQYVTAGLDPKRTWDDKIFMFKRAMERYCSAPRDADENLRAFYQKMCELVRRHAGVEAVHAARKLHEELNRKLKDGKSREDLEEEAEQFFLHLFGHERCPDWCSKEAAAQIAEVRDYWI